MAHLLSVQWHDQHVEFTLEPRLQLLGRSSDADLRVPETWALVSGRHLQIRPDPDHSEALQIRDGCDGQPSTNGTQLNRAYIASQHWVTLKPGDAIQIGSDPADSVQLLLLPLGTGIPRTKAANEQRWTLQQGAISIGRSQQCDVVVEGPTVSRQHCVIRQAGAQTFLIDQSQNGVFVNEQPVNRQVLLADGDVIKVGTSLFRWTAPLLQRTSAGGAYRIDVRDLWLKGRVAGANLSIEPGQLVAFVGGSGAGKSSLLTTIVGQNMDYQGSILINGSELRQSYASIKQEIGFVPQDDIVHLDLTVEEVLRYSAQLKLPDPQQRRDAVERVLQELELGHRRQAMVRDLSGGQRKRVSIGVELIADPRILFLDEPTSGLDPGLDKRMMELLRRLADSGRTVALVTHATNNVMLCDQVVFLGRGGSLCYAGPPQLCLEHFGLTGDFSDIYQHLERTPQEITQLAEAYRPTLLAQLPAIDTKANPPSGNGKPGGHALLRRPQQGVNQFTTLFSRDLTLALRDRTSLILNSLTAPIAVLMISFAASNRSIFLADASPRFHDALRILFVIVCATIWVGLSTSLQAMVKERAIFRRERSFNLLPEAYVSAKLLLMVLQALLQALLIMVAVSTFFESPEATFLEWPLAVALVAIATLITIGAQSLLVSSLVSNSQQASSAAPLLLIPQLIFGGVLFQLKDSSDDIYPLITSRWAMRALGGYTDLEGLVPKGYSVPEASAYAATKVNIGDALEVLALQAAVFVLLTFASILWIKHNR
ncbi:MAG: ATP-binding cassette domain-containing protein [Cyanobacteriota bacterium]|nr:ATP-binding cassette domain-containing protein [Cyanobacteriota bacterium]